MDSQQESEDHGFGFRMLDPTGASYPSRRDGSNEMLNPLPRPWEKWGPWYDHPNPAEPDGEACGPGGFHIHKRLSYAYAPSRAYPWWCEWQHKLGEDDRKLRVTRIRLRRIAPKVLWRWLRLGLGKEADLSGADLSGAYLYCAYLGGAYLRGAIGYQK